MYKYNVKNTLGLSLSLSTFPTQSRAGQGRGEGRVRVRVRVGWGFVVQSTSLCQRVISTCTLQSASYQRVHRPN